MGSYLLILVYQAYNMAKKIGEELFYKINLLLFLPELIFDTCKFQQKHCQMLLTYACCLLINNVIKQAKGSG